MVMFVIEMISYMFGYGHKEEFVELIFFGSHRSRLNYPNYQIGAYIGCNLWKMSVYIVGREKVQ